MSRKYFGTDGVRGRVGDSPITPDFVMRLGHAAGHVLAGAGTPDSRPTVVIGKDTRISGYMLESALQAGLSAAGVDVLLLGPMPTPAIAYLTRALRAQAGIVISASHNPYDDNGIKFFAHDGTKLPDAIEAEIEAMLDEPMLTLPSARLGRARRISDAAGRYIEFCKSTFPNQLDLRGVRIVVDCAHGATYHIAPHVFHELGADVVAIGASPDGFNINDGCGSTHPRALQDAVAAHGARFGFAFDGDGDRLIMVDADGQLIDGDRLLYIIARHQQAQGVLAGGVVGTLMSNLGLEHALDAMGVPFARARVGDRYVMEQLRTHGWQLGGETSGHIICLDRHTSGDGIVAALKVLEALIVNDASPMAYSAAMRLYPQVLINVPVAKDFRHAENPGVCSLMREADAALAGAGRILLRPSGTEPLLRIMVEGRDEQNVRAWAERLADAVRTASAA